MSVGNFWEIRAIYKEHPHNIYSRTTTFLGEIRAIYMGKQPQHIGEKASTIRTTSTRKGGKEGRMR